MANSVDPDQTPHFALFAKAYLSQYLGLLRYVLPNSILPDTREEGFSQSPLPPALYSKFHFHRKFWVSLINFVYRFHPKYLHNSLYYTFKFSSFILLPMNVS